MVDYMTIDEQFPSMDYILWGTPLQILIGKVTVDICLAYRLPER